MEKYIQHLDLFYVFRGLTTVFGMKLRIAVRLSDFGYRALFLSLRESAERSQAYFTIDWIKAVKSLIGAGLPNR